MIISFKKPEPPKLAYSFCKKPESQAKSLMKSGLNDHCICNECVKVCKERLNDKE
jgi:ATP-dependent protease Clp ATPase subunit